MRERVRGRDRSERERERESRELHILTVCFEVLCFLH